MEVFMTQKILLMSVLLLGFGCASSEKAQKPPEKRPEVDQEQVLRNRFETAYFALACMANRGVDPMTTIVPLKKPCDYLDGLVERQDPQLEGAMRILQASGFSTIEGFKTLATRLKADRAYWNTVEQRFVDELLKCK